VSNNIVPVLNTPSEEEIGILNFSVPISTPEGLKVANDIPLLPASEVNMFKFPVGVKDMLIAASEVPEVGSKAKLPDPGIILKFLAIYFIILKLILLKNIPY
jgi:hypothetical protein